MTANLLETRLNLVAQDARHLCRLCLFAGAGGISSSLYPAFAREIQTRLSLSETEFLRAMRQTDQWWSAKIERMDSMMAQSRLLDFFPFKVAGKPSIPAAKARDLLCRILCLSLQTLSIQTGKNHLKSRDLVLLEQLFENPEHFGSLCRIIDRPIRQVLKGEEKVTSEHFLMQILLHSQLIADYCLGILDSRGDAWLSMIRDVFRSSKSWSDEQVRSFLGTDSSDHSLLIARHPVGDLETLLAPSITDKDIGMYELSLYPSESLIIFTPESALPLAADSTERSPHERK